MVFAILRSCLLASVHGLFVGFMTIPVAVMALVGLVVIGFSLTLVLSFVPIVGPILSLIAGMALPILMTTFVWVQAGRYAVSITGLERLAHQPPFWSVYGLCFVSILVLTVLFWVLSTGWVMGTAAWQSWALTADPEDGWAALLPGGAVYDLLMGNIYVLSTASAISVVIYAMVIVPHVCNARSNTTGLYGPLMILVRIGVNVLFYLGVSLLVGDGAAYLLDRHPELVAQLPVSSVAVLLGLAFYLAGGFALAFEAHLLRLAPTRPHRSQHAMPSHSTGDIRALRQEWSARDQRR